MERNEAIESLRQLYFDANAENKAALECLIPELKESEDEKIRNEIIGYFEHYSGGDNISVKFPKWISYLEKQKEQQPAEWSEEDNDVICEICEIIDHCIAIPYIGGTIRLSDEHKKELKTFLKSLRPQPHWKPSEEQPEVDLEKLGEIARHIIAVKQNVEDMRLNKDEWSLLERIGYPERFNARKEK